MKVGEAGSDVSPVRSESCCMLSQSLPLCNSIKQEGWKEEVLRLSQLQGRANVCYDNAAMAQLQVCHATAVTTQCTALRQTSLLLG